MQVPSARACGSMSIPTVPPALVPLGLGFPPLAAGLRVVLVAALVPQQRPGVAGNAGGVDVDLLFEELGRLRVEALDTHAAKDGARLEQLDIDIEQVARVGGLGS